MTRAMESGPERQLTPVGLVWIDSPYPLTAIGLARILEGKARVHVGQELPEETPSIVIFGVGDGKDFVEGIKQLREQIPSAVILVFGLYLDPALARNALRAGANGYIHAGMPPEQVVRAIEGASDGQLVAPQEILEYLVHNDDAANLNVLPTRQREILTLVGDGLSNAQIATKLLLTESTIKQHLRAAYKALGVKNRTEAARLLHDSYETSP